MANNLYKIGFVLFLILSQSPLARIIAQTASDLSSLPVKSGKYLPDFSYAGYHFGEKNISIPSDVTTINATDYGVIPNDQLDDSKALLETLEKAHAVKGAVKIQLPAGKIILSDVLYFERSNMVFSGAGSGEFGTEIFIPRPMMYLENPEDLKELREYLFDLNKVQKEKKNNIYIPFSQYAWSGGMLWTRSPGARVKKYLKKYDKPRPVLAKIDKGTRGSRSFMVDDPSNLKVGDVVEIQWFNKEGEKSQIITELYGNYDIKIGSHHWNYPDVAIVKQQVQIVKIEGKQVSIKSPLLINIIPDYKVQMVEWAHLEEVGFQHFKITFPNSNYIAHHVEQGYNAIYLTRVFNAWVKDVVIDNADSGILTESIANTSIEDVTTIGEKKAHYTVQIGGVHNVLVKNLSVQNLAVHPLSFNTYATKSVYTNCEVYNAPILDQHSGANHQNLFDNIKVYINPNQNGSYPLFAGGGAGYWKPSHGSFSTFWNINVHFLSQLDTPDAILLNGMKDGANAILMGVNANKEIEVEYGPNAYIDFINQALPQIPSLYIHQLNLRLEK